MFDVRLTKQPQKYLKKLPKDTCKLLAACFEKLEKDPFLIAEPLHGPLKGKWKVRLGYLRIVMEININMKYIKIFYIGPRGDIYKKNY